MVCLETGHLATLASFINSEYPVHTQWFCPKVLECLGPFDYIVDAKE